MCHGSALARPSQHFPVARMRAHRKPAVILREPRKRLSAAVSYEGKYPQGALPQFRVASSASQVTRETWCTPYVRGRGLALFLGVIALGLGLLLLLRIRPVSSAWVHDARTLYEQIFNLGEEKEFVYYWQFGSRGKAHERRKRLRWLVASRSCYCWRIRRASTCQYMLM